MFYRKVVPLNRETHRDLKLTAPAQPLDYARGANLIPAVADEFFAAMSQLPIAFLPGTERPAAVFVCGLRPGTNAFISEDGRWTGNYVPAYLRRYPFIIGEVPDAEPVLCIDEAYEGFNRKTGVALFSKAGEPEKSVTDALALARGYRDAATRTEQLCTLLQRFNLLHTVTLDAKLPNEQATVVHGLMTVDEVALDKLPDAQFLELRAAGFFKPLFAHLVSLRAIDRLGKRRSPASQDAA
jgi:hypothetical protein